jgi:hypothetical protein
MSLVGLIEVFGQAAPFLPPEEDLTPLFDRFMTMDADAIVSKLLRNKTVGPYFKEYRESLRDIISDLEDGEIRKHLILFLDTYYPELIATINGEYENGNEQNYMLLRNVLDKLIGEVRRANTNK